MHVKMKRAIVIAKGRVQRVGYRDLVADWAMDLGVVGSVENQPDGTVKIIVEGEAEILEEFVRKAQPEDDPLIRITQVDVNDEKATGEFEHFKIKRGDSEEETAERQDTAAKSLKVLIKTTAMMNENLGNKIDASKEETISIIKSGNETLAEKQDVMIEKQDKTLTIIKTGNEMIVGKQDQMLDKQDETINVTKTGVNEMRESREENKTLLLDFHHDTIQRFDNLDAKEKLVAAIIESRKTSSG